ncbi:MULTISPECIES: ammonium transporter [unclassified Schlesneria]|uniref:ammonium transporter n=1 Tax=unclassified Schlesneria TaxID=2762017 RepID=UPI002EEA94B0
MTFRHWTALSFVVLCCSLPSIGLAQEVAVEITEAAAPAAAPAFNSGDIAWMLTSSALVLMMTAPGLALFYGGLVRKKNILSVMMQCITLMGLMSVIWALYGYSLCFGDSVGGMGLIGDFKYALLKGVSPYWNESLKQAVHPMYGETGIPRSIHMVFQMMFFIITPALICGAFAERMKFSSMVLFSILWGTFVYCPVAHWVWSDFGWCSEFNPSAKFKAYDFAGGTVVHITSGISALVCALLLGKRLGFGQEPMPPHNLTYTYIGATMLWVGWFGFNAGSAGAADLRAANAFVTTQMAAAAGTLAWAGLEWLLRGKPSILGACSGAVAGLVCVTPASGSATPISGICLGLAAGMVCFFACTTMKNKFGYDDSLDAFGVHGVGGTLGALLTGVFATRAVIPGTTEPCGLLEGNPAQLVNQAIGAGAAMLLAIVGTVIILKLVDAVNGLRVTQTGEMQGLDIHDHGEEGYIFY